jgi:hypothetical protein
MYTGILVRWSGFCGFFGGTGVLNSGPCTCQVGALLALGIFNRLLNLCMAGLDRHPIYASGCS